MKSRILSASSIASFQMQSSDLSLVTKSALKDMATFFTLGGSTARMWNGVAMHPLASYFSMIRLMVRQDMPPKHEFNADRSLTGISPNSFCSSCVMPASFTSYYIAAFHCVILLPYTTQIVTTKSKKNMLT